MAPLSCVTGTARQIDTGVSGGAGDSSAADTTGQPPSTTTTSTADETTGAPPDGTTDTGLIPDDDSTTGIDFTDGGSSVSGPGVIETTAPASDSSSDAGSSSTGTHFCDAPATPCQEYACHLIECYSETYADADMREYNCQNYVDSVADNYCVSAVEDLLSCIGVADCDELSLVGDPDNSPCPDVAQEYLDACI